MYNTLIFISRKDMRVQYRVQREYISENKRKTSFIEYNQIRLYRYINYEKKLSRLRKSDI